MNEIKKLENTFIKMFGEKPKKTAQYWMYDYDEFLRNAIENNEKPNTEELEGVEY